MNAATIRRMIVFGVCTLGVAGLYLVPSVAGSPSPVSMPRIADEPTREASRPTERGRTAFDPGENHDSEPPAAVATISPAKVTVDELSLSWPAATDNRRVIGYRIWLNGYEVATTAETRATLRWFNDDEGQHVVQIKAIDAAGNQSETWSTLLVTRPSPEPTEPPPSTTQPTTAPEPTPTPTPEPSESPSLQLAPQPTTSATKPAPKPTTTGQ